MDAVMGVAFGIITFRAMIFRVTSSSKHNSPHEMYTIDKIHNKI